MLGILDSLGVARAHVVGHDWGAALAWAVAAYTGSAVATAMSPTRGAVR